MATVEKKIAGREPLRVFLYDSGEDKPFTDGKFAIPTAIIGAAGGTNILADLPISWGTTSSEDVAGKDPQFLVLLDYQDGGGYKKLLDFLKAHPAMKETTAVKEERFIPWRYEEHTPGPESRKRQRGDLPVESERGPHINHHVYDQQRSPPKRQPD